MTGWPTRRLRGDGGAQLARRPFRQVVTGARGPRPVTTLATFDKSAHNKPNHRTDNEAGGELVKGPLRKWHEQLMDAL